VSHSMSHTSRQLSVSHSNAAVIPSSSSKVRRGAANPKRTSCHHELPAMPITGIPWVSRHRPKRIGIDALRICGLRGSSNRLDEFINHRRHLTINGCYSREAKAFVEAREFDLGALVLHIPYTPRRDKCS
jgi:hypothetical protein